MSLIRVLWGKVVESEFERAAEDVQDLYDNAVEGLEAEDETTDRSAKAKKKRMLDTADSLKEPEERPGGYFGIR